MKPYDHHEAHDGNIPTTCELCGGSFDNRNQFDRSNVCTECEIWESRKASRKYDDDEIRRRMR